MPGEAHHPSFIQPERAIVVPRARRAPGGATLPLQSLIEPMLDKCRNGMIQVVGPALSGKTTALAHLRAVLPNHSFEVFDHPTRFYLTYAAASDGITIVATTEPTKLRALETFYLAEWTIDDCVAYLVAKHRSATASVLNRVARDAYFQDMLAFPGLTRIVLDELAI